MFEWPDDVLHDSSKNEIDFKSRPVKLIMDTCSLSRSEQRVSFPVKE